MKPSHEKIGKVPHQVLSVVAILIQFLALIIWPALNDDSGVTYQVYKLKYQFLLFS